MDAINRIAGMPFRQLIGRDLNSGHKALAGRVVKRLVDRVADLGGVRCVRTLPLDDRGRVREPTKICRIDFDALVATPFPGSECRQLLERILFVPIEKPSVDDPSYWHLHEAFGWTPSSDVWAVLEGDYERIRDLARRGRADDLSSSVASGHGEFLIPKTAGRDSRDVREYVDAQGHRASARVRGFYLRNSFTATLVRPSVGVASEVRGRWDAPPDDDGLVDAIADLLFAQR